MKPRTCTGCGRTLTDANTRPETGRRTYRRGKTWHTFHGRKCDWCGTLTTWDTDDGRAPSDMDAIRRYAQESGSHFFDADAMHFFGSRVYEDVTVHNGRAYFITSERDSHYPGAWDNERRYTLRWMTAGAYIFEVKGNDDFGSGHYSTTFGAFPTLRAARAALARETTD